MLLRNENLSVNKKPVRLASVSNIDLKTGGLIYVDGILTNSGDRILVKNQTNKKENGIYTACTGTWLRSDDSDQNVEIRDGIVVIVQEGILQGETQWVLENDSNIIIGITDITFNLALIPANNISIKDSNNNFVATNLEEVIAEEASNRKKHESRIDNPHSVTYSQVGAAPLVHTHDFTSLTNKPTTLSGYGITDGVNISDVTTTATANKILKLDSTSKLPASITGNAATASRLATTRTLSLTGDATATTNFDGSANASLNVTLANSGVTAGTYTKLTVDSKGRATSGTILSATDIPSLDWSKITTGKPTTLSGYGITDALNISGGTITGNLTINGQLDVPNQSHISAYKSADSLLSASTLTKVIFDTEIKDSQIEFSTTLSRFTAKNSGIYLVSTVVSFLSSNNQNNITSMLMLYKNGSLYYILDNLAMMLRGKVSQALKGAAQIELNANDYIEIYLYVDTNNQTLNGGQTYTHLEITKIV